MTTKAKLYVDSCCFIDLVKHKRGARLATHNDEQKRRVDDCWVLGRLCDAARDGEVSLVTSMLTVAECLHVEEAPGPSEETMVLFRDFLTSGAVVDLIEPDIFVAERARDLYWIDKIHLKGADGIHVASAALEACAEFLTLDERINRQTKFAQAVPLISAQVIKVLRPSETRYLPVKYANHDLGLETPSKEESI